MELMTTCLEKLIKRLRGGIPEPYLGKMAVSIVKALHYLKEKQGVMHRGKLYEMFFSAYVYYFVAIFK